MTTPELITDEIVSSACDAYDNAWDYFGTQHDQMKSAILAIQDGITRPAYNLLRGNKQDAEAYKLALEEIRANGEDISSDIADRALKGEYHQTDFTEFCEKKENV